MKHFFPFRFDEVERTLWRSGDRVPLTRKAGDVLVCLMDHAGSLLSTREILARVWPDTHVQADNVKVLISEIRRALHDDPSSPKYIESVTGRGYRFLMMPTSSGDPIDIDVSSAWQAAALVRAQELLQLNGALAVVERDEHSHLAIVEGERGLGKTTLCESFARRAGERARIATGRCLEQVEAPSPLAPILVALDDLAEQASEIVVPLLEQTAPSWLARLPRWEERVSLRRHLGSSLAELASELASALHVLSQSAPIVLVLEDLQWGDPETIAVLRGVLGRRPAPRLLVIATYTAPEERSDIQPPRHLPRELQSLVPTTIVSLRPFTREHVATYLAARFGERAAVTITTAAAWASLGHPFLLGGFLETLINAQCLRREAYGWSASDVTSIMRTASVNMSAYYEWHLDRLEIGDRTILEAAAVVGPQFTAEDVALALGTAGVAPIADRLAALSDRGVLSIARPNGVTRERSIRYGFRHAGYGELVARRAPVFERLRAAERLARTSKSHSRRAGA